MRQIAICLVVALSLSAEAKTQRSHKAIAEFKQQQPCPATGKSKGACPGYVIDHRIALCVGGIDDASNMRWMTTETAKAKDLWECKKNWEEKLKECEKNRCFINN
ncbi:HNH endonuclease [Undibacterium sp. Rencai35W]|uniref:HNH endonuclease n=1 Tax=Undibacterium sp. Rencai35W TaxID=3413046 RepID=UPI003BF21701